MAENPIRYQDLISPDDSIEKLIGQLEQLQTAYEGMASSVKQQAQGVAASLQQVSGATQQGRKAITEASEEAKRLEKAYKQLDAAYASNAKEIAKLNVLKREANNYNKNLVLRGKEEIKTREQIKNASYAQLSAQYSLNKAYINSLNAVERNTKANREYIKTTKEIYEQMKKLQADTGKNQLNVGNYPTFDVKSLLGSVIGVTSAMGAAVTAINALKEGIGTAMDYEKAVSGLAAILGTTSDKIGELTEQARHLGATTVFTAKEVAELQTELAKLGYSMDDIVAMTPSVLSFAQATGSSLADAASLTGAALRMFEKDTSSTAEFVDKMAAATTKSALSFTYLDNALSTVAPVANAFGFKIEEVLALLGQLANAGFDASSAATATRNILLNLANANGKLAKALGEPVTDLDSLIKGLNTLNEQGIDLAESLDLTDKRSVAAFNTFLSGTQTVLELRDALNQSEGSAKQMADTMGDNLTGDVKSLQSAWEDLMIEINNGQGILRTAVQKLTEVIRTVGDLYRNVKGWFDDMYESVGAFRWYIEQVGETVNRVVNSTGFGRFFNSISSIAKGIARNKEEVIPEETFTIYRPFEGGTGGDKNTKGNKLSAKEQKAAQKAEKAAQAARQRELKAQEQAEKESLNLRRKYEDTMLELIENADSREYAKMTLQYDRQIEDLRIKLEKDKALNKLSVEDKKVINDQIIALEQVKGIKLAELLEKQAKKQKETEEKKQREQKQKEQQNLRERERAIELEYDIDIEGIDQLYGSEQTKTKMRLEAEKERLKKLLALYEADGNKLHSKEIELIKKQIDGINKELDKNKKKKKSFWQMLGFDLEEEDEEKLNEAFAYAYENVTKLMNLFAEAAEKKKQMADAEVERAQSVLEAEIEARNNGYANEVETARKELEEAKKNQRKAIEEQKRAQRAQELIDTATQTSSLITASANLWKSLSSVPYVGKALAIAAIATMWGSFAAAKIKARQVSGMGTEEYGEGTVELLEGGSHQSGNDIDLGRKRNGTRRRAEGGEFFAVINKRNSRRYRNVIPDVVHSLNDGTFAEKYLNAYNGGAVNVYEEKPIDLSGLSNDVRLIREQGEREQYVDGNGNTVIKYKNLHRLIRR